MERQAIIASRRRRRLFPVCGIVQQARSLLPPLAATARCLPGDVLPSVYDSMPRHAALRDNIGEGWRRAAPGCGAPPTPTPSAGLDRHTPTRVFFVNDFPIKSTDDL